MDRSSNLPDVALDLFAFGAISSDLSALLALPFAMSYRHNAKYSRIYSGFRARQRLVGEVVIFSSRSFTYRCPTVPKSTPESVWSQPPRKSLVTLPVVPFSHVCLSSRLGRSHSYFSCRPSFVTRPTLRVLVPRTACREVLNMWAWDILIIEPRI